MGRRTERMAEKAAMEASEAGRILQAQRQPSVEPEASAPSPDSVDTVEPRDTDEDYRPKPRNEPRRLAMDEVVATSALQASTSLILLKLSRRRSNYLLSRQSRQRTTCCKAANSRLRRYRLKLSPQSKPPLQHQRLSLQSA